MRNLLSGFRLKITAIKESDLEVMETWFNDVQFLRYYDILPALPKQIKELQKYLESFADSNDRFIWAVRYLKTGELIGILGFDDIIWSNGTATVFIGIGDSRYTGMGLGREALQLLLDFGFNELNFYRIQLYVIDYNTVAIKLYESQGFVREGTLRKCILRDGKRHDLHLYSLLKE